MGPSFIVPIHRVPINGVLISCPTWFACGADPPYQIDRRDSQSFRFVFEKMGVYLEPNTPWSNGYFRVYFLLPGVELGGLPINKYTPIWPLMDLLLSTSPNLSEPSSPFCTLGFHHCLNGITEQPAI